MKIVSLFLFLLLNFLSPKEIYAQNTGYVITQFKSDILVQKDTSLLVTETIIVDFLSPKHGIFRIIPSVYSVKGKTINTRLKVISVTDEKGNPYKFEKKRVSQSIELKIGDPQKEVGGINTYVIKYQVFNVLRKHNNNYELYWNITGNDWDTVIKQASAYVRSPYANVIRQECFAGIVGKNEKLCEGSNFDGGVFFFTQKQLSKGEDFTIVVELDGLNQFVPPAIPLQLAYTLFDNWGYFVSPLTFLIIFVVWFKRGRDRRYSQDTIYYQKEDSEEETKPLFSREHLPLVYHPINGLTPSEVGTIIDEKVDIEDVIAEILELARLGFIIIRKIEKRKFFINQVEYAFIKTNKFDDQILRVKLTDYQNYLLQELFTPKIIDKSLREAEKLFIGDDRNLEETKNILIKKEYVLMSGLRNHFYEALPTFRQKLYQRMENENFFYEDPEKVRQKWVFLDLVLNFAGLFVLTNFFSQTLNFWPLFFYFIFGVLSFFLAISMPRRTGKGHSFKRQIEGLIFYLKKGKWRYEIAEKHLFIEEILPLAISLGIVDTITKDMRDLDLKPPSYFSGVSLSSFSNDLNNFKTASLSAFLSTPSGKWSSASSWSGRSGFSGGFSGGGFGGGGGRSW